MKFDFSAHFLRVAPPDTSYGDAWESLCHLLLCAESPGTEIIRLAAPDRGIDILSRGTGQAMQCKSHESGVSGTMTPVESIKSLRTAVEHRDSFNWKTYALATNAWYSGNGFEQVLNEARQLGLKDEHVVHLGPHYWDGLCAKHSTLVEDRFYYRVTAEERHVIEAFKNQRYHEHIVKDYQQKSHDSGYCLVITNNRTPIEASVPFSPQLTVKNLLDVAKDLLGVTLNWTNFPDLSTSAGRSLSITIDRKAQLFDTKIADLPIKSGDKIELWIKLVWKDGLERNGDDIPPAVALRYLLRDTPVLRDTTSLDVQEIAARFFSLGDRTIARAEAIVQDQIWKSVKLLLVNRPANGSHG